MTTQTLINRFNEKYPIGALCPVRTLKGNSAPYVERVVTDCAYELNGIAVAFFEGLSGCNPIEPGFVDYSGNPPLKRQIDEYIELRLEHLKTRYNKHFEATAGLRIDELNALKSFLRDKSNTTTD